MKTPICKGSAFVIGDVVRVPRYSGDFLMLIRDHKEGNILNVVLANNHAPVLGGIVGGVAIDDYLKNSDASVVFNMQDLIVQAKQHDT